MTDAPSSPQRLSAFERALLWVTYAPPLAWWPVTSRLLGVRMEAARDVAPVLLRAAESDSRVATKWTLWLIVWAVILIGGIKVWGLLAIAAGLGAQFSLPGPVGSSPGDSPFFWLAAVAVLCAVCAPLFLLGRKSVLAARTGVSVALSLAASDESPDLSAYPRMAFVLPVLVPRMRRP